MKPLLISCLAICTMAKKGWLMVYAPTPYFGFCLFFLLSYPWDSVQTRLYKALMSLHPKTH